MPDTSSAPKLTPEELKNRFQKACLLHENGDLPQAIKKYQELLQLIPESSMLNFNCGLALFDQKDFVTAEKYYAQACALCTEDPDIHYNRGLNFRRLGQIEDGVESFEKAFQAGDHSLDTLYNLALSYQDISNYSQAAILYESILTVDPEHTSTLNNFAFLCHKTGDLKKAETLYRQLVTLDPKHKAAAHMLYSLSGITPETAPLEYVESVFDNFAQNFENSLTNQLFYKTPTLLKQRYQALFPNDTRNNCLDLGCGTGLAGLEFSACCKQLIGIDISSEMLAIAEEKNIYKKLIKTDLTTYLNKTTDRADIIIAADVFTYLGNLDSLFQQCFSKTTPSGLFLFSVEDSDKEDFELKETGRFGHSLQYIQRLCQKTGWTICDKHFSNLRKDNDKWITGILFILQK